MKFRSYVAASPAGARSSLRGGSSARGGCAHVCSSRSRGLRHMEEGVRWVSRDAEENGRRCPGRYQSVDNPNDVTVTHDFHSLEQAKAFAASPELKSAMEKSGVKGAPQIWYTTKSAK